MLDGPRIITGYPAAYKDMKLIDRAGRPIPNPVTIEHTLTQCSECGDDCWIGPKQRLIATFQGYPIVCYTCTHLITGGRHEVQGTNMSIEDVQRRFPT